MTAGPLTAVVVLVAPAGRRLTDVGQVELLASAHVADETGLCRGCALWWSAYVWWPCSAVRWARPELRVVDTWVPAARLPAVDRASPRGVVRGE